MTQEVSERGTVGATFAGILMIIGGILGVLQGIIFVSIQAIWNFLYIPFNPWASIVLILIDFWIIHSLFVHRRELV
jgi:hypothetical protein